MSDGQKLREILFVQKTLLQGHSAPEENSEEKKGAGILSMVFGTI